MELVRYNAAKQAVAACVHIDECKDWKDKAAAMAAYAKMRDDEELENSARRIRARATRRIGELLLEIAPSKGGAPTHKPTRGPQSPSNETRKSIAETAGLSTDDAKTAIRIARVPDAEFEEMVERERPATLDELAERGRAHRDPSEAERRSKNRREALKSFKKWCASWSGLVPELDKVGKSIAAIEMALSEEA